MASRLRREQLARAARALNACARALPSLVLMTDEKRLRDPVGVAWALPKGAAIVLRHTDPQIRAKLGVRLMEVARAGGLKLLIAGDPALAVRIKAHGLHLPETRAREARHWKALHPSWFVTAAAHSLRGLALAASAGTDAAFLATVFATESHAERAALGAPRARLMAANAILPVYALGGIDTENARLLRCAPFAGIAAIGALIPDQS